jgi:hypothetical protein
MYHSVTQRQANYVLTRFKSWRSLALCLGFVLVHGAWAEEKLESLTVSGNTFSNVTIITRTATHVSFKHAHGFASVRVTALEPAAQTKVGYKPPPPRKTMADRLQDWTAALDDPRLHALEEEIRAEVDRVLAEEDKVIIHSALGGAACIYILFCLAAIKICRKTTVRPGLWVWLPGFQWISLLKAAGMSPGYFFLLLIPPINLIVMTVWCFRICRMRQKSPSLGFLLLIPVVNIFVYFYLAFSSQQNAPASRRRGQHQKLKLSFQN